MYIAYWYSFVFTPILREPHHFYAARAPDEARDEAAPRYGFGSTKMKWLFAAPVPTSPK
jgi:hypothetical protein